MALVSATAVVCEKVLIERDEVSTLVRVVDLFTVPENPNAVVQFSLWVQIKITADDESKHSVHLELVRPSGERNRNPIVEDTALPAPKVPDLPHKIIMAQGNMIVQRPNPGLYAFEVLLDGEVVAVTHFFIIMAKQEPSEPSSPSPNSGSVPEPEGTIH